jgi:hypothetical protein
MRDFVERLETGLVQAAERETQRSTRARLARSARTPPLGYRNLTALATAAVLAVVLVLSTGPSPNPALAALPVLLRPSTNASAVRPYTPVLSKSGASFGDARAIQTPYGRGYVIPAPKRGLLCLAIPDTVLKSYGETCTPVDQAERTGIVATLIAPHGGSGSSEFVGVFPDDASRPEVTYRDGRVTRLALHDGVAAATFDKDVTIAVHVGKAVQTVVVPAHEPQGAGFADCGGGRIVPEPKGQTAHEVCRGK